MKYVLSIVFLFTLAALSARAQQRATLPEAEVEKLRDTQDPGERIKLYAGFMQERLAAFDQLRHTAPGPKVNGGQFLNKLLGQYVELDDEMKDWIQFQFNHEGDMRKGLRALLDTAPRQLDQLRHIKQTPDAYASGYSDELNDAIADLKDTLDGATAALAQQQKKLGELKQQEKQGGKRSNASIKEEKKRIKQEEKLRKKEEKQQQDNN